MKTPYQTLLDIRQRKYVIKDLNQQSTVQLEPQIPPFTDVKKSYEKPQKRFIYPSHLNGGTEKGKKIRSKSRPEDKRSNKVEVIR